ERGGTRSLDLGGGLRAVAEYGTLRFSHDPDAAPPEPVELPVPGRARFGEWEVEARLGAPGEVSVRELGASVLARPWREGDLMRHMSVPCEIDFMAVSSYGSSTDSSGIVRILKDLDAPIQGRDVLIVEDIVDSGLTLSYLLRTLRARDPASLEVCALLTKPE